MPHALNYSRPIVGRDTNAFDDDLYPLAIYCGVAPLALLVITFILWLPTRWMFLEFLGLWTILLGLVMFIVGTICIIAYIPTALVGGDLSARNVLLRASLATFLLILNIAGSVGIVVAASAISPTLVSG